MPRNQQLIRVSAQNLIDDLVLTALGQECIRESLAIIVITAIYERMERKYGQHGELYVKIEEGGAVQSIHSSGGFS